MLVYWKCECFVMHMFRRDMGLYEVPLSMYWLGFWIGTMLANFQL